MKDARCRDSSIVLYLWSKWGDVTEIKEPTQVPGIKEPTQVPGIKKPTQVPGIQEPSQLPVFEKPTQVPEIEELNISAWNQGTYIGTRN